MSRVKTAAVFISYRRSDCPQEARLLADLFAKRWGRTAVYFDVESNRLGEDYRLQIGGALSGASVVIALIGREWVTTKDAAGNSRLSAIDDWVREELYYAIRNGLILVPVYVQDAAIPNQTQLPIELRGLPDIHGIQINADRFDADANNLAVQIESLVARRFKAEEWKGPLLLVRLWLRKLTETVRSIGRLKWVTLLFGTLLGATLWYIKQHI